MKRDAWLVALSLLPWGIGEGLFIYFHPLYLQQQFHASPLQIGGIFGLAGGALALVHIPAGALADRVGRKGLIVSSWVLQTLAALTMFLAPTIGLYTAGFVLYNLGLYAIAPTASYVASARGSWPVQRVLTTMGAFFGTGAILGPAIGGYLANTLGLRAVYGFAVLFFVASTCLVLLIHAQPVVEPEDRKARYAPLLTNRALGRLILLAFLASFGMFLSWPLTPNFLRDIREVTLGQIGLLGSFNALGGVALSLGLGRIPARRGFIAVQGIVALSVVLLWQGQGMAPLALGFFLSGGFRAVRAVINSQVEPLVHPAELGLAFGLAETAAAIVLFLAAPLAGLLYSLAPDLPFPVSLGLIGAAMGMTVVRGRRQKESSGGERRMAG